MCFTYFNQRNYKDIIMKKALISFAVSALFAMGTAHAESTDTSATLNITGTVTEAQVYCAVNLNTTTVNLTDDMSALINQGTNADHATDVYANIVGSGCSNLITENKFALKVIGTADNALGNALANSDTSETAAKGVAVGIFNESNQVVKINDTQLPVSSAATKFKLQMVKLDGQTPVAGNLTGSLTVQIDRI